MSSGRKPRAPSFFEVRDWNEDEVAAWLHYQAKLPDCAEQFRNLHIDGEKLVGLSELQIKQLAPGIETTNRRKVMRQVKEINKNTAAGGTPGLLGKDKKSKPLPPSPNHHGANHGAETDEEGWGSDFDEYDDDGDYENNPQGEQPMAPPPGRRKQLPPPVVNDGDDSADGEEDYLEPAAPTQPPQQAAAVRKHPSFSNRAVPPPPGAESARPPAPAPGTAPAPGPAPALPPRTVPKGPAKKDDRPAPPLPPHNVQHTPPRRQAPPQPRDSNIPPPIPPINRRQVISDPQETYEVPCEESQEVYTEVDEEGPRSRAPLPPVPNKLPAPPTERKMSQPLPPTERKMSQPLPPVRHQPEPPQPRKQPPRPVQPFEQTEYEITDQEPLQVYEDPHDDDPPPPAPRTNKPATPKQDIASKGIRMVAIDTVALKDVKLKKQIPSDWRDPSQTPPSHKEPETDENDNLNTSGGVKGLAAKFSQQKLFENKPPSFQNEVKPGPKAAPRTTMGNSTRPPAVIPPNPNLAPAPPPLRQSTRSSIESNSSDSGSGEIGSCFPRKKSVDMPLPPVPNQPHGGGGFNQHRGPLPIVPDLEPQTQKPLESHSWYFGVIDRNLSATKVKALHMDGAFMIRKSTKDAATPFTLCLWYNNKIWNLHIRKRATDNRYALGTCKLNELAFDSVQELVEHHKSYNIVLAGSNGGEIALALSPPK